MTKKDRVFLVGVFYGDKTREYYDETMEELHQLADTAGADVVKIFIQTLKKPDTATYVGKGKIKEISSQAGNLRVNTLIFNNNLSPSQSRNISNLTRCNVVDRTEIILDIFAIHARTKQAKLQVEMAQLEYSYTKLKRMWKHLSRIQGGIGFRGPGETQIEVDRREIRKKVSILKKYLKEIENTSLIKRKKRNKLCSISLVGYTNAGKSTLFNKLTNENRFVADQLFATLDSLTRAVDLKSSEKVVLTDTIGFIRDLPHKLISSFHSTLLEVIQADLLLHVVDISFSNLFEYIDSVNSVLAEIGVEDKNILMVFNKCDKMKGHFYSFLKKQLIKEFPDSVFVSAKMNVGLEKLIDKIEEFLRKSKKITTLEVPCELQNLISFVYENSEVLENTYRESENIQSMKVKISRKLLTNIQKQIADFNFKKYINKKNGGKKDD